MSVSIDHDGSTFIFPNEELRQLPLRLLALLESLENGYNLLERGEVGPQLSRDGVLVGSQLGVEVLAVRASTHGRREDGLDKDAVVGLKGRTVGATERVR